MTDTVLVVGPDRTVAEFLAGVLRRHGHDARSARTDAAAVRVNEDDPPLVLVDTDLEAVRSIRALADQQRAAVPIVVLGAEGAPAEAADDAVEAGATHHVARPIADTVLVSGVRTILDAG